MIRSLDAATLAMLATLPRHAAMAGLAAILDLYGRLLDARTPDEFDELDAEIAVARAELFPLLDAARGPGAGQPLRAAAAELRRHVDPDQVPDPRKVADDA